VPELQFECPVGAPVNLLWPELLASHVHAARLPCVQLARVLSSLPAERTVEWSVLLRGAPLRWVQYERIDAEARSVTFQLIRGDLKRLRGIWSLRPTDKGSIANMTIDIDFGLPRIAVVFNPLLTETLASIVHGVTRSAEPAVLDRAQPTTAGDRRIGSGGR
jgi:ribosome-associated toxin RatA of RatAB toxin-antitoxin module